jgi:hypothetical protein
VEKAIRIASVGVFGSNQKINLPYKSILLDCPHRIEESQASKAWCETVNLLVDAPSGHLRNGHVDRLDGSNRYCQRIFNHPNRGVA